MAEQRESPVRLVSYQFAKAQGALLLELSAEEATVCLREGARAQALAELRRVLGVPIRVARVEPPEVFERQLAEAYTRANQSAAYVADNLEQDMDLSRLVRRCPVEDLLGRRTTRPSSA
jgi:general secretion pathway protein E